MTAREPIWPDTGHGMGEGRRWPPFARVALALAFSLALWVVMVATVCMALASPP
jgi:hypothetical protein